MRNSEEESQLSNILNRRISRRAFLGVSEMAASHAIRLGLSGSIAALLAACSREPTPPSRPTQAPPIPNAPLPTEVRTHQQNFEFFSRNLPKNAPTSIADCQAWHDAVGITAADFLNNTTPRDWQFRNSDSKLVRLGVDRVGEFSILDAQGNPVANRYPRTVREVRNLPLGKTYDKLTSQNIYYSFDVPNLFPNPSGAIADSLKSVFKAVYPFYMPHQYMHLTVIGNSSFEPVNLASQQFLEIEKRTSPNYYGNASTGELLGGALVSNCFIHLLTSSVWADQLGVPMEVFVAGALANEAVGLWDSAYSNRVLRSISTQGMHEFPSSLAHLSEMAAWMQGGSYLIPRSCAVGIKYLCDQTRRVILP